MRKHEHGGVISPEPLLENGDARAEATSAEQVHPAITGITSTPVANAYDEATTHHSNDSDGNELLIDVVEASPLKLKNSSSHHLWSAPHSDEAIDASPNQDDSIEAMQKGALRYPPEPVFQTPITAAATA